MSLKKTKQSFFLHKHVDIDQKFLYSTPIYFLQYSWGCLLFCSNNNVLLLFKVFHEISKIWFLFHFKYSICRSYSITWWRACSNLHVWRQSKYAISHVDPPSPLPPSNISYGSAQLTNTERMCPTCIRSGFCLDLFLITSSHIESIDVVLLCQPKILWSFKLG